MAQAAHPADLVCLPYPRSVERRPGERGCPIDLTTRIMIAPDASADTRYAAETVRDAMRAVAGIDVPVTDIKAAAGDRPIRLVLQTGAGEGDPEGYSLAAGGDGVTVTAATEAGLFYGCQTLIQLVPQAGQGAEGMLMTDWGDYGHFGMLENGWYLYLWAAECGWGGARTPVEDYNVAVGGIFLRDMSGQQVAAIRHELGLSAYELVVLADRYDTQLALSVALEAGCAEALDAVVDRLEAQRRHIPTLAEELLERWEGHARHGEVGVTLNRFARQVDQYRHAIGWVRAQRDAGARGEAVARLAAYDGAGLRGVFDEVAAWLEQLVTTVGLENLPPDIRAYIDHAREQNRG